MLKKIITLALSLIALPVVAQTYHYPALETNNTFTGTDTFNNTVTLGGSVYFPALTVGNCLKVGAAGLITTTACVQTPAYAGLAASDGAGNWVSPTSGMVTTLLGYVPLNPANNLTDLLSLPAALNNLGAQPISIQATTDPPTATCSSTVNTNVFAASTSLKLYQCSNNNGTSTYLWNNVGASSLLPNGPAYSLQVANTGVTGFASDSLITIIPGTHTLNVGGTLTGNKVTLTTLSTVPANWVLDLTTPATALASLGDVPAGSVLGPSGTTNCLRWDGTGRITTLACSGAGTVTSVNASVPSQMTVTGGPITSVGTLAFGLNTTGSQTKVVTAGGSGVSGHYAMWNGVGGLDDSGVPAPPDAPTDYYWTVTNACSTSVGQPVQCTGTTTLPGAMPDAAYQISCTADLYAFSGAQPNGVCALRNSYPLPTASGSTLTFSVVQVMQNGGGGGSFNLYFHAHHN